MLPATARCVMYDSMKCDIFMLNYIPKEKTKPKLETDEADGEGEDEAEAERENENGCGNTKRNEMKRAEGCMRTRM